MNADVPFIRKNQLSDNEQITTSIGAKIEVSNKVGLMEIVCF